MLKKPLFWVIVVLVIIVLAFIFSRRSSHENANMTQATTAQTSTMPADSTTTGQQ